MLEKRFFLVNRPTEEGKKEDSFFFKGVCNKEIESIFGMSEVHV